jgi:hypothetical protein
MTFGSSDIFVVSFDHGAAAEGRGSIWAAGPELFDIPRPRVASEVHGRGIFRVLRRERVTGPLRNHPYPTLPLVATGSALEGGDPVRDAATVVGFLADGAPTLNNLLPSTFRDEQWVSV